MAAAKDGRARAITYNHAMTGDSSRRLPFSQRNGLVPVPSQLKLGEVSNELKNLLYYAIHLDIERESTYSLSDNWRRIAQDMHVRLLRAPPDTFKGTSSDADQAIKRLIYRLDFPALFDFVEFFLSHPKANVALKRAIAAAFVDSRAAYRVVDLSLIVAIGNEEQAEVYAIALEGAHANGALGARKHLIDAGAALKNADWAGCVRESIHAVESIVTHIEPAATSLRAGLAALEAKGHIHGGLKSAFGALYGYSSDEAGIRHALVFAEEAKVDEADALFMIGACASFVSYVLARAAKGG